MQQLSGFTPEQATRLLVEVRQRRLASIGEIVPAKRFESITITRDTTGTLEAMPHWAGQSVASVKKIESVAKIVDELA